MRGRRTLLRIFLASGLVLAVAGPAKAATLVVENRAGIGTVYEFTDSGTDTHTINVVLEDDAPGDKLVFDDIASAITLHSSTAGFCVSESGNARCDHADPALIEFNMGEGNDTVLMDNSLGADIGVTTPIQAFGGNGNDSLEGGDGNDPLLDGGAGIDLLEGFAGNDRLEGGTENDTLRGNDGAGGGAAAESDTLLGEAGADTLAGDTGNDSLDGGTEKDTINGGEGGDVITDPSGLLDQLNGNAGVDTITGGDDSDAISGGADGDILRGKSGNDSIVGDTGVDTIVPGFGADNVNGGAEIGDRVSYAEISAPARAEGVTVTLGSVSGNDGGPEDGPAGARDVLIGIERVTGSEFADSLTGSAVVNILDGLAGNDTLIGLEESDTLNGGEGEDTLDGGVDNDSLNGDAGNDTADYSSRSAPVTVTLNTAGANDGRVPDDGATANTLDDINSTEVVLGGSAGDSLTADAANGSRLVGNDGDDTLNGGAGGDTFDGGDGADTMDGKDGVDTVTYASRTEPVDVTLNDGAANDGGVADTSGANRDTTIGIDNVVGGSAADTLTGDGGANQLEGGAGDDALRGLLGPDVFAGNDGTDTVTYSERSEGVAVSLDGTGNDGAAGETDQVGNDVEKVEGGGGNDTLATGGLGGTLSGLGGADTLTGGAAADTLLGGDGNDLLTGGGSADSFSAGAGNDTLEAKDGIGEGVDCGDGTDGGSADQEDQLTSCEGINPPVTVVDNDKDGVPAGLDCDDNDALRKPGNVEIPGNARDEDCLNGPAPFTVTNARLSIRYIVIGGRTRITTATVSNLPAGTRVLMTCKPPKGRRRACPFRKFDRTFAKATPQVNLRRRFKKRRLVGGLRIVVRVIPPLEIGIARDLRTRRGKLPVDRSRCVTPGTTKLTSCG